MNKTIKIGLLSLGVALTSASCSNDFVEREFYQNVEQAPLTTSSEVESFVRGIYTSMRATAYYGADHLAYGELRSDEMYSTLSGGYYLRVYNYSQLSNDTYAVTTYNQIYAAIAKANIVIGTDVSKVQGSDLDRADAQYAIGQAYGLRALAFFDAFRLYGQKYIPNGTLGIVLPLKYDPKALQPRATIAETEAQIEADFAKAESIMKVAASMGKTDFGIYALWGMMSRYYLYKGDYAKVRTLTNNIYKKYEVVSPALHQMSFRFIMNGASPNSIFELGVGINASLSTGSYRQRLNPQGYANIAVRPEVLKDYADNDIRKKLFSVSGGVYYLSSGTTGAGVGKYTQQQGADNIKMLRYEEILLNGVEAELNGGSAQKALEYYNLILENRILVPVGGDPVEYGAKVGSVDMKMLKLERKKELIGEGLRQWDLRRWGDPVPRPAGVSTDERFNAFPIPRGETDILNSPVKANPGYDNSN